MRRGRNGRLYELQTGKIPTFGTSFKSGWDRNGVYFAIRCDENPGEQPVNAATRDDDTAVWNGDVIEIQIATETHSYYQIAISPEGQVVDLDREASKGAASAGIRKLKSRPASKTITGS